MGQIYEALIRHLRENNFKFQQHDEDEVITFGIGGENGKWNVLLRAQQKQDRLVAYSLLPMNAPLERRPAVCEFLARANYGLILGNFEMDLNDGEVRYKTSLDLGGQELTEALIHPLLGANFSMMNRYLPGLMKVMFSNDEVVEAIKSCEGKMRGRSQPSTDDEQSAPAPREVMRGEGKDEENDPQIRALRRELAAVLQGGDGKEEE